MLIQAAHISHLSTIFKIFADCKSDMERENIFQWTATYPGVDNLLDDILRGELYGMYEESQCLGVICLNTIQDTQYKTVQWQDVGGKPLIIHRFAVAPPYQRLGIGGKLMAFAEEYAMKGNYSSLRFDAYSGNRRALRFYEQRGYQKKGEVYFPGRELPFFCFEKVSSAFRL